MVFNVFICFIMFFDICSILFCKRAFAPHPLANFKSLPKFFFSITLKEHLEAQLRYTLWQTSRVCQSFFLHYFKRAFRSTIALHPLANFKSLSKFFFFITLKEHLEAQLRHTLWQTLRVCQSFFSP